MFVRPDYQKLGQLKNRTGSVPWAALTATATPAVVEDIVASLKLGKDYKTFKLPCFRKNIFYDVQFTDALTDEVEHLKAFVEKSLGAGWNNEKADKSSGCGIVYCRTRFVPDFAREVRQHNIDEQHRVVVCNSGKHVRVWRWP